MACMFFFAFQSTSIYYANIGKFSTIHLFFLQQKEQRKTCKSHKWAKKSGSNAPLAGEAINLKSSWPVVTVDGTEKLC